jgi:thiamine-phosphate pyrophosphorylase
VCARRGLDPIALAEAFVRGGARILQVRDKGESSAAFLALVRSILRATRAAGGRVIVNDRADIARLADADGVHVGQDDLPVEAAIELVGRDRIVGVSTHDRQQVDRALAGSASYVAVGPVFETSTKVTGYESRGLALIRYAAGRGKPIVAIGGITLERAPEVAAAGAAAVAVISDLLAGDDPEARARAFLAVLPAQPFNV